MSEAEEEDGQPDIEDDEIADFSEVAAEIDQAVAEEREDDDDGDQEATSEGKESDDVDVGMDGASSRTTVGDVYCNALGMTAAVARSSYGSADRDDRADLVEDYGDLARQLEIDQAVDDWLEEQGGMDELTPGQAIVVSTLLFAGMVAMDDPELIEGIAEEVGP